MALFREVAGDRDPPRQQVRELWCIAGRWSGKDSIASGIACVAALADYRPYLRPGEVPVILCLASDRDQAKIVHGYIAGYFQENPVLRGLVARETGEGLDLTTGISIVIGTNNYRAVRGRTVVCAILDEVGVWRSDAETAPDIETYTALTPAMVRVPGSMLIGISLHSDAQAGRMGENDEQCWWCAVRRRCSTPRCHNPSLTPTWRAIPNVQRQKVGALAHGLNIVGRCCYSWHNGAASSGWRFIRRLGGRLWRARRCVHFRSGSCRGGRRDTRCGVRAACSL